ncbi:MAG: hypothetical protein J0H82_04450 [Alphaproteobacteria bacterium]|jgi:hypothetical protein|nr:hypothetical protein [Alphaproteobacteria bacterium]
MISYLDAVRADYLPGRLRGEVGRHVVPPLLRAAAARGLQVEVSHALSDFWQVCEADPGRAVASQFVNPAVNPGAGPEDTLFVMLTRAGRPVASSGARLKWVPGTLAEAIDDGSLLYPAGTPVGYQGYCHAPAARRIGGWVAVYTAFWRHPNENANDPVPMHLTVRLLHALTLGRWGYAWAVSFAEPPVARRYARQVWLAEVVEAGAGWSMMGRHFDLSLVAVDRAGLLGRLADPRYADPAARLHLPPDTGPVPS